MTNIDSDLVAAPEPATASPSRPSWQLWPLAAVAALLLGLRVAPDLWFLLAFVAPAAFVVALFVPQVHRLPALARILIYLASAASFLWLALFALFLIVLSGPNVHMG